MEDDEPGYYILVGRAVVPATRAEYFTWHESHDEPVAVGHTWVCCECSSLLAEDDPHCCGDDAVVSVTTYFNGAGGDYRFYTELWTDTTDSCEQEVLVGYMDWDDALVGHDLVLRLIQAGRLEPCTCGEDYHIFEPRLGVLGR